MLTPVLEQSLPFLVQWDTRHFCFRILENISSKVGTVMDVLLQYLANNKFVS